MLNRIVFIDSKVIDYQNLLSHLPLDSKAIILKSDQDGLAQICAALQDKTGLDAIDIISHGKPGALLLGSGELNNANLLNYAEQLEQVGMHMSDTGDILLYGCEVAQGKQGRVFIEQLSDLIGANIAASTNLTGAAELGGDWVLEVHAGDIKSPTLQLSYSGVLATLTDTIADDLLVGTSGNDIFSGGQGNDTLVGLEGYDRANYAGFKMDFELSLKASGEIVVRDINLTDGNEGADILSSIELLHFFDGDWEPVIYAGGGEFRVNTYTIDYQIESSITALSNGGFVVSWQSLGQDGGGYGIYAQRYDASYNPVGGELRVNTNTALDQSNSSIAALSNGGFVISWQSLGQDGAGYGIYAQRYDANGGAQGSEFKVNTFIPLDQNDPSITALTNGGFVVSWVSLGQDGYGGGIYAQRYDANGVPQGSEFKVNTYTSDIQNQPSIAALSNGGFVVSYASRSLDGNVEGIYAQRYDANGIAQGNEFRVNTYTFNQQSEPSIAALSNGGFVVSWQSLGQDGSGYGVYAQRYDANGIAQGNEFRVNTTTADSQWLPTIVALSNSGFVVTWSALDPLVVGSNINVYVQRYDANGIAQGGEMRVNTYTLSVQAASSIAALPDGGFVVSWESYGQDGSERGIYSQRFDANGNPVPVVGLLPPNHVPTIVAPMIDQAIKYNTLGWSYDTSASFNDVDSSDHLSYSAKLANDNPLPAWMQINATTGLLTGTPGLSDRGTYALNVTATDLSGASVNASMTVAVTEFDAGKLFVSTNGNDTLAGTIANDMVTYAYAAASVTVSLAITTQQNTVSAGLDTITNINNLSGSNFNDTLTGDANNNALSGGAGNDSLTDEAGDNLLEGNDGDDLLVSGSGNDTLEGGNGNDVLRGGDGINHLFGDAGDDTFGATGRDNLTGGDGIDTFIFGGALNHFRVLDFDLENDILLFYTSQYGIEDVNQLVQYITNIDQRIDGVTVEFGSDASIELVGINLNNITIDMISFW